MKNTDSIWKKKMRLASKIRDLKGSEAVDESTGYWLQPFRNFKADCPYFVGDYDARRRSARAFDSKRHRPLYP